MITIGGDFNAKTRTGKNELNMERVDSTQMVGAFWNVPKNMI